MNTRLVASLAVVAILSACGQGSDLKKSLGLALSSTQGFIISPRLAASHSPLQQGADPQTQQALYAIDASGTLTEVQVTEDAHATVTPLAIYDTPKFVLFVYEGVTFQGKPCRLIPVRKSDGAMFCVDRKPTTDINQNFGNPPVQTDASGDLIFVMGDTSGGGVYHTLSRLDMAANPPTETALIADSDAFLAYNMIVNGQGDALVGTANNSSGTSLKVYPRTGDVQSVFGRTAGCLSRNVVGDETGFVFEGLNATGDTGVYRLDRQADGTYAQSLYAATAALTVNGCRAFVRTADRVYVHGVAPSATFGEMVNPSAMPTQRTIPGVPSIADVIARGEFLYAYGNDEAGNGQVVKYRLDDGTVTTLLGGGEYRIGKLDVSGSGDVTFSGTRNSDGVPIIGNLTTGATQVQVLTQNAPQVTQIARIN